MVLGEELAPRAVAELSGLRRRPHDVGEEHRGEYPVGLDSVPFAPFPDAREEAFHVLGDLLGALGEPGVTVTGQDDQFSAGDVLREIACRPEVEGPLVFDMEDQRRH